MHKDSTVGLNLNRLGHPRSTVGVIVAKLANLLNDAMFLYSIKGPWFFELIDRYD